MHEYLPRLLALLVVAEKQRGGFIAVPEDLPNALTALGQDESRWLLIEGMLDDQGYFAHYVPHSTPRRVLTAKARAIASKA